MSMNPERWEGSLFPVDDDDQCDATIETGMPDGPEKCLRTAHVDNRHEGEHLEWWDDDEPAGGAQ